MPSVDYTPRNIPDSSDFTPLNAATVDQNDRHENYVHSLLLKNVTNRLESMCTNCKTYCLPCPGPQSEDNDICSLCSMYNMSASCKWDKGVSVPVDPRYFGVRDMIETGFAKQLVSQDKHKSSIDAHERNDEESEESTDIGKHSSFSAAPSAASEKDATKDQNNAFDGVVFANLWANLAQSSHPDHNTIVGAYDNSPRRPSTSASTILGGLDSVGLTAQSTDMSSLFGIFTDPFSSSTSGTDTGELTEKFHASYSHPGMTTWTNSPAQLLPSHATSIAQGALAYAKVDLTEKLSGHDLGGQSLSTLVPDSRPTNPMGVGAVDAIDSLLAQLRESTSSPSLCGFLDGLQGNTVDEPFKSRRPVDTIDSFEGQGLAALSPMAGSPDAGFAMGEEVIMPQRSVWSRFVDVHAVLVVDAHRALFHMMLVWIYARWPETWNELPIGGSAAERRVGPGLPWYLGLESQMLSDASGRVRIPIAPVIVSTVVTPFLFLPASSFNVWHGWLARYSIAYILISGHFEPASRFSGGLLSLCTDLLPPKGKAVKYITAVGLLLILGTFGHLPTI
ncbi:hypothetical protein FA15DRAFT_660598 [Coprinopsis marcescibilis]|uniref:Uncharacterized protein n=1 Tax=Coprinopsis marcescibilis TaxID=230819 RepID=A0A5C3KS19_COPMA|nr:hypothetical protein FA15DRAFT_660598 [Coprinopsis marcescibilis]